MRARLTLESGNGGGQPTTHDLVPEHAVTLGRSRDNTIVLRDEHASRLHAKIYFADGAWLVRDFGLNGTRINGERIHQQAELEHGQEIRIGDTRLRFTLLEHTGSGSFTRVSTVRALERPTLADSISASTTRLQPDELTVLCQFMAAGVSEENPQSLVRQALVVLLAQTNAHVAGFLNVDPGEPLTKLVLPETASVDVQLSRQLTRRVQRDGNTVWLGAELADTLTSESLLSLNDALCVPVKYSGTTVGAIHVYKTDNYFTERDVRFCEAVTGFVGSQLHVMRVRRTLEAENTRLRGRQAATDDLVGDSPPMQQLRSLIARAAPQPLTVLVTGESGSGKELVALALHRQSPRCEGPLVAVNCAAIAPSLLEAELFGYRKGAFSGADRDHPGLFQQADEGTLFLDEVAELSQACQAKLLRAIDTKSFRPVGATGETRADVRIIAATHRDLDDEVRAGRFRADLSFRLKVIRIHVPPLREHPNDIPYLVQYFLDRLNLECRRQARLTEGAMQRLQEHPWPGNVRQLRAVLESSVAMCESDEIDERALAMPSGTVGLVVAPTEGLPLNLTELEEWAMRQALARTDGNVTQAARVLGISRDTLTNRMRDKKISRPGS